MSHYRTGFTRFSTWCRSLSSLARSVWNPPMVFDSQLETLQAKSEFRNWCLLKICDKMWQNAICSVEKLARNPCLVNMVNMNKYDKSMINLGTQIQWLLFCEIHGSAHELLSQGIKVPNLRLLEGSQWCYVAMPCKFSDTIQGNMTPPEYHLSSCSGIINNKYVPFFPFFIGTRSLHIPSQQSSSIRCSLCFLLQVPKVTHFDCLKWPLHRKLQVRNPASIVSKRS